MFLEWFYTYYYYINLQFLTILLWYKKCFTEKRTQVKTLLVGSTASFLMVFLSLPLNKLLYNGTSVSSSVSVSTSTSNNDEDNKGTILSGWVRSK